MTTNYTLVLASIICFLYDLLYVKPMFVGKMDSAKKGGW